MKIRILLIVCVAAVILFMIAEVRQWIRKPDFISHRQRVLRSFGFGFLLAALGLWINGTTLADPLLLRGRPLTPELRKAALHWLSYWMVTFLTLVPLIPLALLDTRENLRRIRDERRRLKIEATADLEDILQQNEPSDTRPATPNDVNRRGETEGT
ncbi:MAG: hypothetical protein ACLQVD_21990 [Capsulimonadaceae bacterium]